MLLGGRLTIMATAKPGHTLDELGRAIDAEVARLRSEGPTPEEVEMARNKQLADFYRNIDSLEQRADLLNHYEQLFGDPGGFTRDLERYRLATPASVRAELAKVTGQKRVVLRVVPAKKSGEKSGEKSGAKSAAAGGKP
jgi:predicted Zn-dependent peptidase